MVLAVDAESVRHGSAHVQVTEPPEGFWYAVKHRVLGPPLVTEQLTGERLSRPQRWRC